MTYVINMWISYFNELVYKVIRVMSNVKKQKYVALMYFERYAGFWEEVKSYKTNENAVRFGTSSSVLVS